LSRCHVVTLSVSVHKRANKCIEETGKKDQELRDEMKSSLRMWAEGLYRAKDKLKAAMLMAHEEILALTVTRDRLTKASSAVRLVQDLCQQLLLQLLQPPAPAPAPAFSINTDQVHAKLTQELGMADEGSKLMAENKLLMEAKLKQLKQHLSLCQKLWSDKCHSLTIECSNIAFCDHSAETMSNGINASNSFQTRQVTLSTLQENVETAWKQLQWQLDACRRLREFSEGSLLSDFPRQLRSKSNETQMTLANNECSMQQACQQLKQQLQQLEIRLARTETIMTQLTETISVLNVSRRDAQCILDNRSSRMPMEKPFDHAEEILIEEISCTGSSMEQLVVWSEQVKYSHQELVGRKICLQEELALKMNSMRIDGDRYTSLRIHYPSLIALSGL